MAQIPEHESGIVWCHPWGVDQGDYVRVNVADFDPSFHKPLDAKSEKAARKKAGQGAEPAAENSSEPAAE